MRSSQHYNAHRRIQLALAVVMALILAVAARPMPASADGVVQLYYFYDPECPVCQGIHREVIEPLMATYGERLVVDERNMSDPVMFQFLLSLEAQAGVKEPGIPEIFIGQDALIGPDAIRAQLQERIDYYLSQGGVSLPVVAGVTAPVKAPTECSECDQIHAAQRTAAAARVTPSPSAVPSDAPVIHAAWLFDPGCDLCQRKEHDLQYAMDKYPQLTVRRLNSEEEAALFQYMCLRASVPEDRQLIAPTLFVGQDYLVGEEITGSTIEGLIQPYLSGGAAEPWAGYAEGQSVAQQTIVDRFRSLGLWTVVGAGLIDGVNPCAFATMIFLISYLSVRKRRGRDLLATGAAFTLGVFLAYLGMGLGLLRFLTSIPALDVVGKWIYGLTMVICLALAWGSINDYRKARQGRLEDMSLKLPDYLRGLERRLIREGSRSRYFVLAALPLGFAVSVVELACTGQVYLPTIIFVLGLPEWRTRAALALVFYNLMFIVPLIIVFVAAYFGTTSQQLTRLLSRHAATVKLGMAVLFLLLAAWLGYSIISI